MSILVKGSFSPIKYKLDFTDIIETVMEKWYLSTPAKHLTVEVKCEKSLLQLIRDTISDNPGNGDSYSVSFVQEGELLASLFVNAQHRDHLNFVVVDNLAAKVTVHLNNQCAFGFRDDTGFFGLSMNDVAQLQENANDLIWPCAADTSKVEIDWLSIREINDHRSDPGNARKFTESVEHWLIRVFLTDVNDINLLTNVLFQALTIREEDDTSNFDEIVNKSYNVDRKVTIAGDVVRVKTIISLFKSIIPSFDEIVNGYLKEYHLLQLQKRELSSKLDQLRIALVRSLNANSNLENLPLREQRTKFFISEDMNREFWQGVHYVGSIELHSGAQFDCGIWRSADGKHLNATWVDSMDYTQYQSSRIAQDGIVIPDFRLSLKINDQSPLTTVKKFIFEKALELGLINSGEKL